MKLLQQIFVLLLFTVFLASCSGTKATKTIASTENQSTYNTKDKKDPSTADKSTLKEGSSAKNAIKVKSIPEEYEIVRKLCPNCKINGQSLVSEGKKYYDVLRLTNEKGEEVNYYFDINSFFGK